MDNQNNLNLDNSINKKTKEERQIYEGVYNLKMNQISGKNLDINLEKDSTSATKTEKPQYGDDILRLKKEIEEVISNKKSPSIIKTKREILENMDKQLIIDHIMADDLDDYIEKQIAQQTDYFFKKNKGIKIQQFENKNNEKKEFISLEDLANTVYSNIESKIENPIKNDRDDLYIDLKDFQNSLMDFYKENNQKTYIVNDENGNIIKYKLSYKNIKEFIEKLQDSCKYVINSQTKITNENTKQEKAYVNQQDILENMSSLFRKKYPWVNISSVLPIQEMITDSDKKEEIMEETPSEIAHMYTFSYDGEENELGNIVLTLENGEKIAVPNGIDPTVPGTLFSNEDGSITYTIGEINEENKPVISVEFNDITKRGDDVNSNSINQTDSIIDMAVGGKK